jgi:hypothetical protein
MEKTNLDLGGFDAILGDLTGLGKGTDGDYDIVDPKEITGKDDDIKDDDTLDNDKDDKDDDTDDNSGVDGKTGSDTDGDDTDSAGDDSDFDDGKGNKGDDKDDKDSDKDDDDEEEGFGEHEADLADYVQEKLFQEFGWEKGEESFESMEEVVGFLKKVVKENSQPDYADEELYKIDEYVRNGGRVNDYMSAVHSGIDLETIDLDKESDQKALVRENLKLKGYSEARIKRAVERYEDAGTLQEEAEDAEELVKEYNSKIADKLLEQQKNERAALLERQQEYYDTVETEIQGLDNVRGIDISDAEKKQLTEYIFKPTANGKTQYQNDYIKNQKNLIESAYFTMKGDKLIQKVQKKASSDATKRIRVKLASKGKRGKDQNIQSSSTYSFLDSAYSQLKKPKF